MILKEEILDNISPEWVLHNGVAYIFPEGGKIFISQQQQSGSWYDINHTAPRDTLQKKVFTIGFNHGKLPTDASYAYIVAPGKHSAEEIEQYRDKKYIEIYKNTPNLQVVRNKYLGIWGMVFYNAGEFKHQDIQVTVDKACILMIKDNDMVSLHVADPEQVETDMRISVCYPARSREVEAIHCNFKDSGVYAGATKVYNLQF